MTLTEILRGPSQRFPQLFQGPVTKHVYGPFGPLHCLSHFCNAATFQIPQGNRQPVIFLQLRQCNKHNALSLAPGDLKNLGSTDFIHLDDSRPADWASRPG